MKAESFTVTKNSKVYGRFDSKEDADLARELLAKNDWDLSRIPETVKVEGDYLVIGVIDEKMHFLARYAKQPSSQAIERLVKKRIRNPNNSRYGLNISRIFETFIIKKRIAGEDHIFGYYDNLEDATFIRNFLLDNMWNVDAFSHVHFDDETDTYKIVEVIDDKAYVIGTIKSLDEVDLEKSRENFLLKIAKHKFGLESHPYLDELTDRIEYLEGKFNIKIKDDNWSFEDAKDPLNDIIFSLTPFQQSVYDAVDDNTFDEIKRSLLRFKSKNFDAKIQKNLDELADMGLISRNQNSYVKRNL